MKKLIVSILILSSQVHAQVEIEKLFGDRTKIENPMELRDPFRSPDFKTIIKKSDEKVTLNPEEALQNVQLNDIRILGVLIGKERRAVVKITTNEKMPPVIIKEGFKLGPDRVEVKAILPGGVILVEKMVNVYGQEEYLETVIPISK